MRSAGTVFVGDAVHVLPQPGGGESTAFEQSERCITPGPLIGNSYAEHVAARLRDFFEDTTPWERRLFR
jgi:hypothetical protein